jgi:hypothetical protein
VTRPALPPPATDARQDDVKRLVTTDEEEMLKYLTQPD